MGLDVTPSTVAAAGGPSLDQRTQLPRWSVVVYPDVGEATICWTSPARDPDAVSDLSDEQRQVLNHERATRRASSESRRYLVANRLRYMWILTFAGDGLQSAEGRRECMQRVAGFAEALRARHGAAPYWYSPELHPGGHGWHVNFFVGRRLAHAEVAALWGLGFVYVKDWVQDSRVKNQGLTLIEAIRLGAQYACKYASKDWAAEMLEGGAHRYEVAQGFKPRRERMRADSLGRALRYASHFFGGTFPPSVWRSDECEGWTGPPVYCLSWAEVAAGHDDD